MTEGILQTLETATDSVVDASSAAIDTPADVAGIVVESVTEGTSELL